MTFTVTNLFPTPIFHTVINEELIRDELNILEKKLESADVFKSNRDCNLITKEDFVLDTWRFKKIKQIIVDSVKLFADEVLCYEYDHLYITQSWVNVNPPGSSHHSHMHLNSVLSGVLFLNTFEKCGDILFYPPFFSQLSPKVTFKEDNDLTWGLYHFTPSNGDLIIFPSYFEHAVSENLSEDKNRVSLSFNTFFTPMGDRDDSTFLPNLDNLNTLHRYKKEK
jgi:uncharacterized protein (TIGR02466 family)